MSKHSLLWWVVAALGLVACQAADSPVLPCYGKCEAPPGHHSQAGWVVDMRKAPALYGSTGRYFFGLVMGEEVAELAAAAAALEPLDQQMTSSLRQVIAAEVSPAIADRLLSATYRVIWDQLHDVARGWPTLIFADGAAAGQALPAIEALALQRGYQLRYQVVVIDEAGRHVAAPGRLSIVPMLDNTAPSNQLHLRAAMQDGDVIAYVHPEARTLKSLLERRSSHVAMHYELITADGAELVHHIDNPKGFGPPYNHKPNRQMPFHFYRFAPPPDRAFGPDNAPFFVGEMVARDYRLAARNWALLTSEIAPFAGFFDLRLQRFADLEAFVAGALQPEPAARKIPNVYCSGLAYANLNLGLNRMLNAAGLGARYGDFAAANTADRGWSFFDAAERYTAAQLHAPAQLQPIEELVFDPYDVTDLLDAWLENAFKSVPLDRADPLPSENPPVDPLRRDMIRGVINEPSFQRSLLGAFRGLEWSDDSGESSQDMPVATVSNARLWAMAYGLPTSAKEAFLDDPCQFAASGSDCSNLIDGSDGQQRTLREAIAKKGIQALVDQAATPYEVIKLLAQSAILTRFLPPRIWLDEGERDGGNMVYVGTVLNCKLLAAADGSNADACAGSGQGAEHYLEGAADTHTYAHYAVTSGGQRTHRRIDAATGPQRWGVGTTATVRFTAPDAARVLFALHVPEHYLSDAAVADTLQLSLRQYESHCNARNPVVSCAPSVGIALQPQLSGAVLNHEIRFDVLRDAHCAVVDDDTLECDLVRQKTVGGGTEIERFRGPVARAARGFFTATMLNEPRPGSYDSGTSSECQVRQSLSHHQLGDLSAMLGCSDAPGSAHFDVFHIAVWNK